MENVIGPLLSGFGAILGKLFGHPFDFLAGKSCSLVCGLTWDFFCYIENFCISHLLKLAMVSILFYFEEEQGQGSLYRRSSRKIEGRRSVRDQRKEHFRRSLRPKNNKMHQQRRR
uniref:Uncharacterized protein LOC104212005 n=1 Tax=Nicotiana sylvestris TaxID=4096 RepID=A0A1U7VB09_NICSY|nr:PREDICTED: uncharacterized protein LOC104212005 [Nicotiana sylvestris]